MAAAIRSIPHHAFNDHTQCGIWCGYIKDKENYDHRTVPGGFNNQNLFKDLKEVFYKLADNAKFACGASSNRNESLNATSKDPKSRCYSMSAFADFRFSCSVAPKKSWGKIYPRNSRKNSAIIRKAPFTPYYQDKQNLFATESPHKYSSI